MKLASFNNNNYVVDLEWRRLSGTKVSKELEDISRQWSTKSGVLRSISDDEGTRYQIGFIPGGESPKEPSAAAVLASISENIVLIDQVDNDLYWVCGISEGEIVATSDVVVSGEDLSRHFDDIKESFDEAGLDYRLIAPEDIISQLHGDVDKAEFLDFSALLEQNPVSESVLAAAKIKSIKSRKNTYIIIGAAMSIGVAFLAASTFRGEPEKQDSLDWGVPVISQAEQQNELERKRAQELINSKNKALGEEEAWLAEILTRVSPLDAIDSFLDAILLSKNNAGGWNQKAISWVDESNSVVRRIWDGNNSGSLATPITLEASLPSFLEIDVDLSSTKAATTHEFKSPQMKLANKPTELLSEEKNSIKQVIHTLKKADFLWKIDRKKLPLRKVPVGSVSESEKWEWINPIRLYSLEINGSDISRFRDMKFLFHEHNNIVIKHMYYDSQASTWRLIGEIYEYSK